ncbi:membrane protein [Mycobacterium phage Aegeus]|nr:membrane protein [Mycobacterium phage Baudelaire]WKW86524.1 membrane protein [Mycobacterium phage Aegeus]
MGADLAELLSSHLGHWPLVACLAALLLLIWLCVRFLALTSESFSKALGPIGKFIRARRALTKAEADILKRQVIHLDGRVRSLLYRDECYFAYMLSDQEWHHRYELKAAAHGWSYERHVPFLEFRDRWMRERGLEKELELWR